MTPETVFTSRLAGRRLLDSEGLVIGRVKDVVLVPAVGTDPPRATGLVVTLHRRQIFVSLSRVAEVSVDGVSLEGSSVDLGRFSRRAGELLASELYDRKVDGGIVLDVGLERSTDRLGWEVSVLAIGQRRGLLRQPADVLPWSKYRELFDSGVSSHIAGLRDLHPTDLAGVVESLPAAGRRQLADALQDEELADVLQEMPEPDQIGFLAGLGAERVADIVEEMEPDDAVDLLAAMSAAEREQLLAEMPAERAADLRRLLSYDATSAGGLMTSRPVVVTPEVTVAEALARIRQPGTGVTLAAQIYVCEPPSVTPSGPYLGTVGFQRLLRELPSAPVGQCIESSGFIRTDLPEREVAARLAAYNLVAVAVCDAAGRLVGAVTVDDVLDRLLPANWRKRGD
jgi:CBS domain-containing protein/sporulation protein YlmC with PRC-barrel domain